MIWYVDASLSIPSWWMPASCANAFAPTIGLLRCDGVAGQLGRRAPRRRGSCAGSMPVSASKASARTRSAITNSSSDCVARPLADAVDGALDLRRAGSDAGERVRDGEAEIVVAVDRELDVARAPGSARAGRRTAAAYSTGEVIADRVGQVDDRRAGLDRRAAGLGEERAVGAGRVLGRELDLVGAARRRRRRTRRSARAPRGGVSPSLRSMCSALVAMKTWMRRRGAPASACGGGVDVPFGRAGKRGDGRARRPRRDSGDALRNRRATRRRSRPRSCRRRAVRACARDLGLLVRAQRDARRLLAVPQSRVEDLDPAHSIAPRSGVAACGTHFFR